MADEQKPEQWRVVRDWGQMDGTQIVFSDAHGPRRYHPVPKHIPEDKKAVDRAVANYHAANAESLAERISRPEKGAREVAERRFADVKRREA